MQNLYAYWGALLIVLKRLVRTFAIFLFGLWLYTIKVRGKSNQIGVFIRTINIGELLTFIMVSKLKFKCQNTLN